MVVGVVASLYNSPTISLTDLTSSPPQQQSVLSLTSLQCKYDPLNGMHHRDFIVLMSSEATQPSQLFQINSSRRRLSSSRLPIPPPTTYKESTKQCTYLTFTYTLPASLHTHALANASRSSRTRCLEPIPRSRLRSRRNSRAVSAGGVANAITLQLCVVTFVAIIENGMQRI